MNIVLAGNPNAGKTTLFNALTGSNLRTGNFHGVTTTAAKKRVKRDGNDFDYFDVPGMYAFKPYSMEEQAAIDEIKSADLIVNVVDALTLESSLNLTRAIIASGKKVAVYLTKVDTLKKRGGFVDEKALAAHLGAPVYICTPKKLKKILESGALPAVKRDKTPLNKAYYGGNLSVSRIDKLFYNRFFALAAFVVLVVAMFFFAFHPIMPGAYFKGLCEELICVKLCGAITGNLQNEAVISLVEEGIFGGVGSVLCFIPQLFVLYLFLTVLDESGIMSALAFTTDGLFEKVRLSGRAAFSLVSGFGCTAAAILTTRGYSAPAAQRRTVAVLPFIPCGAKLPVFLTFLSPLFKNPFPAITVFYFVGVLVAIAASALIRGGGEGMLSEVTPIILPQAKAVAIKLCFHIKGFIIKVASVVAVFCVASWFLAHFSFSFKFVQPDESILAAISRLLTPLFKPMGLGDWRLAYAALCGFIAKENVAATYLMLMPEGFVLGRGAALAMCTFMLFCPACVSALSASVKEVGAKFTFKCAAIQLLLAFASGYLVYFCYENIFGFIG